VCNALRRTKDVDLSSSVIPQITSLALNTYDHALLDKYRLSTDPLDTRYSVRKSY